VEARSPRQKHIRDDVPTIHTLRTPGNLKFARFPVGKKNNHFEPSVEDVLEYATSKLGMRPNEEPEDRRLLWIAVQALQSQLPTEWRACEDKERGLYYYNTITKATSDTHPSDAEYLRLYHKEKAKNVTFTAEPPSYSSSNRSSRSNTFRGPQDFNRSVVPPLGASVLLPSPFQPPRPFYSGGSIPATPVSELAMSSSRPATTLFNNIMESTLEFDQTLGSLNLMGGRPLGSPGWKPPAFGPKVTTAHDYETQFHRTTRFEAKASMLSNLKPVLGERKRSPLRPRAPKTPRTAGSFSFPQRASKGRMRGFMTERSSHTAPIEGQERYFEALRLARHTLRRMEDTDGEVQKMQRRWITKCDDEQASLQRILSLIVESAGQMNTKRNQSREQINSRRSMSCKAVSIGETLRVARIGRDEVLEAAQNQHHIIMTSVSVLLDEVESGCIPEEELEIEMREISLQVRSLHASNNKIIKAAQHQVKGIHDQYQQFEKEFKACIGDSLTRLASPRLIQTQDIDAVWKRSESVVDDHDELEPHE